MISLVSLVDTVGAKLSSLKNRNYWHLRERDKACVEASKVRSKLELKHQVKLSTARTSVVKDYKSSTKFENMWDDLYSTSFEDAVKILGPKNPNLDILFFFMLNWKGFEQLIRDRIFIL